MLEQQRRCPKRHSNRAKGSGFHLGMLNESGGARDKGSLPREGAGWDVELLASIGQQLGSAESLELCRLANTNPPELLRFDASGERLDDVRFHPAWHLLMQGLFANRVHGATAALPQTS